MSNNAVFFGGGTVDQGLGGSSPWLVDVDSFPPGTSIEVTQATPSALNATVVQPTGTNLHAVIDSGTLTTVSSVTAIANALPAGSNVIGHVIADTGSTTAVTGNVTVVQPTGTSLHAVIDTGSTTAVTQATASALNAQVVGNIAHDGVDSGNPVEIGNQAVAYGTTPTAVAAGDRTYAYANRAGIPFTLFGHPNVIGLRTNYTGAQTNTAVLSVSAGTKIVVVEAILMTDAATTAKPSAIVGFGTSTTPTGAGVIVSHPGISPGSGVRTGGVPLAGADDEDVRITCADPTGGSLTILLKYFTIAS